MVVGIYSVPEMVSPKRRCSEGSPSVLPWRGAKRCREEPTATAGEPTEALSQEPLPAVVLLEGNGGIWHVDGLLELLAGALCATLGADPSLLDMTCTSDPATGCSTVVDAAKEHEIQDHCSQHHQQQNHSHQQHQQHQSQRQQQQPRPTLTELTERNLKAHTAAGQLPVCSQQPSSDDEDRSSVASLSAWVVSTQSPRKQISEGGSAPAGSIGPARSSAAPAFSFAAAHLRCGGASDGGCSTEGFSDLRWLRRHCSSSGRR